MPMPILAPAALLVVWSIVMLIWAMALRMPALAKAKIPAERQRGGRGVDLNRILPPRVMWKTHNYDHLMEQPTLFYAVVLMLAVMGHGTGGNALLAWVYVALRIVHSLWQATVNGIGVRMTLFVLSTVALGILAINALRFTLGFA